MYNFAYEGLVALSGWARLNTNPMPELEKPGKAGSYLRIETDQGLPAGAVASIYGHLSKIASQGNCPFAPRVKNDTAAYLHLDQSINTPGFEVRFARMVLKMASKFLEISPLRTCETQKPDFTTLFTAFIGLPYRLITSQGFSTQFSQMRRFYAPIALASGLTLADSGPAHPDPEGDGRNVTAFPTLIMHRLHKEDRTFMQSLVAKEIFGSYFPGSSTPGK